MTENLPTLIVLFGALLACTGGIVFLIAMPQSSAIFQPPAPKP